MKQRNRQAHNLWLLHRWIRQVGSNPPCGYRRREQVPIAVGYEKRGPVVDQLIAIEHLVFVVLCPTRCPAKRQSLRLGGYGGSRVPWGVKWGGPENNRFEKDLALPPMPGGNGRQLDLNRPELVTLGLQLHARIQTFRRGNRRPRSYRIRLPQLWAAFDPADAGTISADGSEVAAICRRTGQSSGELLDQYQRNYLGLTLYPLNWVSHLWKESVAVFADLARFPKRQVIHIRRLPRDLKGFRGASQFDFYTTRFGRRRNSRFQNGLKKAASVA